MAILINLCNDEIERREDYDFLQIKKRAIDLAETRNSYIFSLFEDEYKLTGIDLDGIPTVMVEGKDSRIVAAFLENNDDKKLFVENANNLGLNINEQSEIIEDNSVIYVETNSNPINIYTVIDIVKTVHL